MPDEAGAEHPRLEVRGLTKSFGSTTALRDFELVVAPGEVHGLIGRNGSGKSTLIKILSGYHHPDRCGVLAVGGRPMRPGGGISAARRAGLSFVHQDLGLIAAVSVLENMRVGRWGRSRFGLLPWRNERAKARRDLASVGLNLDLDTRVRDLTVGERSLVAIARALGDVRQFEGRGVLVLDEPTVSLAAADVERLFTAVRAIARSGTSIVFISHRLAEVKAVTDRVTVIRDGVRVATFETGAASELELVDAILGRRLTDFYPTRSITRDNVVLSVRRLTAPGLGPIDLDVRAGETVGLTGLAGSGHDLLPYLIAGVDPAAGGEMKLESESFELARLGPARALNAGVVLIPADRRRFGIVAGFSLAENVSLPMLTTLCRWGLLSIGRERRLAQQVIERYGVVPPLATLPAGNLSGGNQQKLLVAKWLQRDPRVVLMHEPTQGVDVAAKRDIFAEIERTAETGAATLICSNEYEDLAHICHRVLVLGGGTVATELVGELNGDLIVEECYRASAAEPTQRRLVVQ